MDRVTIDPLTLLRPRRRILGASAVLLPFTAQGAIDWGSFELLVNRTLDAGLIPAVNMDTGYVNLIEAAERAELAGRGRASTHALDLNADARRGGDVVRLGGVRLSLDPPSW